MKQELDNSNVSKHLGKTSEYKSQYDPSLLVREPRSSNRKHLNIEDDNLPFVGFDTWNAYEVSALTYNGMPVTGIAKIVYSASSKYIVESKSLKLYFNSFNMTKIGSNISEVLENISRKVKQDLSELLDVDVKVNVASNGQSLQFDGNSLIDWRHVSYETLEEDFDTSTIVFSTYVETPELLEVVESIENCYCYHSALLKSNCRVTSQPDWGDVYIFIEPDKLTVTPISLLKYIISFRDECHFHEEICETIYKRLNDLLKPKSLGVRCLYARRGGIDINPERVSNSKLLVTELQDENIPHTKTPKQ